MSLDELQQKDIEYMKDNIARIEKRLDNGFEDIKQQIILMGNTFVRQDVHDRIDKELKVKNETLERRIESIEASNRWLFRTVISTVIGLLATVVLTLLR